MGILSESKLVIAGVVLIAFLCLGGAYKIKSYQLSLKEAQLATVQAENTGLKADKEALEANQAAVKVSQARQQARASEVGEIRERIVTVQTEELSDVEKDLCAIITRLFNGMLKSAAGGDTASKAVLPAPGQAGAPGADHGAAVNR